ncbi:uncharacterized protein LOC131006954 [Salvia miltiorrhiza]|uniref:uncharacterized protein LOC131006954 n=1 Tax=Salvia miltiorrhiza TaxID=226208 RepID=UPI0025AD1DB8|nr:uncharacterized protein LOC131006954 [Salvia miltiorrhiza]
MISALSYNIIGLGSSTKENDIREMVRKEKIDFCFIQETKAENHSKIEKLSLWGVDCSEMAVRCAKGRSGGILSTWNKDRFAASSSWDIPGAVIVNGIWKSGNLLCCFVNVYAPIDCSDKVSLWETLKEVVAQNKEKCLVLAGDFNSVRKEDERAGRGGSYGRKDMRRFDEFIRESMLVEIPTPGRKFTWYQASRGCKSRLDRILVHDQWLRYWPATAAKCLPRTIFDHCPIIFSTKKVDWGPRPFRFINAWMSHPDFKQLIQSSWNEKEINGWSYFVFKEKLKFLKQVLKGWNKTSFGDIDHNIQVLKDEILHWDTMDDVFGLEDHENICRNEARAKLLCQTRNKNDLLRQKARIRWLQEGDLNTKFYHRCVVGMR